MPYRRRRSRRTRRTRRSKRSRQSRGRKAFMNAASMFTTLRQVATSTSDAFGAFTLDTTPTGITGAPDWANFQALYDSFVVHAIKITLFPINVGDESSGVPHFRGSLASIIDLDGTSVSNTVATMVEYDSFKLHPSRQSKISRYLKIPKNRRIKINDLAAGFNAANDNCHIRFVGENFTASQQQYYFVRKYWVSFIGRR